MRINVIETKLEKILENYDINIYSIKTKREYGEKILEILLKGPKITIDVLETIHMELYNNLEDGDLDDDYFLELSSLGAEYPLESLEEIIEHLNSYVYVRTERFQLIGTILSVNEKEITFEYNDKGQFRKMKIEYDEILEIRTRVKV